MATEAELREWVPDEYLEALVTEKVLEPELTHEEQARRILMRGAPMAASAVVHLSVHGKDERVRMAAAKYVIDGVVGGGFKVEGGADDLLVGLILRLQENDIEVRK